MSEEVDDFLEHYGVKGMKWGVRRNRGKSGAAKKEASKPDPNDVVAVKKAAMFKSAHFLANRQGRIDGKLSDLKKKRDLTQADLDDLKKNGVNSKVLQRLYGEGVADTSAKGKALFILTRGATPQGALKARIAMAEKELGRLDSDIESVSKGGWTHNQKIAAGAAIVGVGVATYMGVQTYKSMNTKAGDDIGFNMFLDRVTKSATKHWSNPAITEDAFKMLDDNDLVLPPRTTLHRISTAKEDTLSDRAYASFDKEDVKRYRAFFTREQSQKVKSGADFFDIQIQNDVPLISPSKKKRVEAYMEVLGEKDPTSDKFTWGDLMKPGSPMSNREKGLETYNQMVTNQTMDTALSKAYFNKLREKGYNMVVDDMDAGVIGDTPVILLDKAATRIVSANPLPKSDIDAAKKSLKELRFRHTDI